MAPRFRVVLVLGLLACAACSSTPSVDWKGIAAELDRRAEEDQAARNELMESFSSGTQPDLNLIQRLQAIDAENTSRMKAIVSAHGWPTISRVGPQAAANAWLLVQHADEDVDFQEHCLELLRAAVEAYDAEPKQLAYLLDRVAMHRGRPQRYGTQFVQVEGELRPHPIEDPEHVDERRASVGLEPLADYAARVGGRP